MKKWSLGFLLGLGACFVAQWVAVNVYDMQAGHSESNYFSSLIRVQEAAKIESSQLCLVGSSIIGKLNGVEAGEPGVMNLGVDGGCAETGIDILELGKLPSADVYIIEANTLLMGVGKNDQMDQTLKGVSGPWFTLGTSVPPVRYSQRPTSILYSLLRNSVRGSAESNKRGRMLRKPSEKAKGELVESSIETLDAEQIAYIEACAKRLKGLPLGSRVIVLRMPTLEDNAFNEQIIDASGVVLADMLQTNYFNLDAIYDAAELRYSDKVHLSPVSAAKVLGDIRISFKK